MAQDVVLTRAVMRRKKWPGNPVCSFCQHIETSQHLFFECSIARVIWRAIGVTLGTDLCPKNCWQFFVWCYSFIPDYERFYTVVLGAVTWSIWLARNRATFENKMIKSPFEIVYSACSFLLYWAGLQPVEEVARLRLGAEMIRASTTKLMAMCEGARRATGDEGEVFSGWCCCCALHSALVVIGGVVLGSKSQAPRLGNFWKSTCFMFFWHLVFLPFPLVCNS